MQLGEVSAPIYLCLTADEAAAPHVSDQRGAFY